MMSFPPEQQDPDVCDDGPTLSGPLTQFRTEFENLVDHYIGDHWGVSPLESVPARLGWGPRIDLVETHDQWTLNAELPGIDPGDVDVSVKRNTLTISGEKRRNVETDVGKHHYVERRYGRFVRTVRLPGFADAEDVNAEFKNGVLTITLSKRAGPQPTRIEIRQG